MRSKVFCNTCGVETATVEDWNCRPDTEADTLRAEAARLTAYYREACEQRDTLQADVWRLREAVEIADARFSEHGMETMTARLEEYGYDHEAEIHQLATYRAKQFHAARAALAHGEADQ